MPRTKNSAASKKRKKKILKRAEGFRGGRSKLYMGHKHNKEDIFLPKDFDWDNIYSVKEVQDDI